MNYSKENGKNKGVQIPLGQKLRTRDSLIIRSPSLTHSSSWAALNARIPRIHWRTLHLLSAESKFA